MSFASSSWHRRPQSQSSRTFVAHSDISSNLSRARSIKNVKFEEEEEKEEPYVDPSIPKGRGEGLGLPDFLKKRAMMPKVVDPMEEAFNSRAAAGSLRKPNPKAPKPIETFFKLKQVGKGPMDTESEKSVPVAAKKPPKAVYVKKNRQELYDHKLELKPFNWYDQKGAKATLDNFIQENVKQKGEVTDIQEKIRAKIIQSRDIMKNFDKGNSLKTSAPKDPDAINPTEKQDEKLSIKIWDAFGRYIAKNLKQGKAIHIPKFGLFTFTFPNHLKMAGLNNPWERDQQIRTPVFVMGKDFVQGVKLKAGIAGSWAHDIHVKETRSMISSSASDLLSQFTDVTTGGSKNTVIPFELRNNNGIVPKHDINYLEISLAVGGKHASKQTCKDHCELIYKKYAARAAAGKRVEANIPHVGKLSISIGICAVIFNRDIIDDARGKTAINYKDRHHSADVSRWNNFMNGKELEKDRNKAAPQSGFDAMKKRLDREYDSKNADKEIENMMAEIDEQVLVDRRRKEIVTDTKIEVMQSMLKQRPGSAYGARSVRSLKSYRSKQSSVRALSRGFGGSVAGSAMSVVPELDPAILMSIAWEVYGLRTRLVPKAKQQRVGLREMLTSSKLQKLLQAVGYNIKIGNMKALLKEIGFNWNGASCSITQLIEKLRIYTKEPKVEPLEVLLQADKLEAKEMTGERQLPVDQETLHKIMKTNGSASSLRTLGELIYNQEKSLHDVFEEFKTVNANGKTVLGFYAFEKMAQRYANNLWTASELRVMFDSIPRALPDYLSFNEFEAALEIAIPEQAIKTSQYPEPRRQAEEQRIVTKVLDWLHRRGYPAEDSFERLLRSVSRGQQKSLRRYDFQKAIKQEDIGLTTPDIDFLFDLLAGNDRKHNVRMALEAYRAGEMSRERFEQALAENNREAGLELRAEHWLRKIKTVARNPLDHIRKCVREAGHTESTMMQRLGLKLSDQPLDFEQFQCAIQYIDPTFSDLQTKKLFAKLRGSGDKIPINSFVKNILGHNEHGTVDSQKKMLKRLYDEIYRKQKSKEFMRILEKADNNNDGKLEPVQVGFFIKHITGGPDSPFTNEQIEEFVAQLPKVDNQKILYVSLLDLITSVGNRNHNPFKSLIRKLDFFLDSNKISITELLERLDPLRGRTDGAAVGEFAKFLKDKIEKGKDLANLESYARLIDIDKDGRVSAEDLQTCLCNIDSDQFFKNGGQNLKQTQFNAENKYFTIPVKKLGIDRSDPKIFEIRKQLARALKEQGKTLRVIFSDFDSDGDGMLNFGEFSKGIRSIMSVNQPTIEKIFNIMDENKIGMVDFDKFYRCLFVEDPRYDLIHHGEVVNYEAYDPGDAVEDSFDWQNQVVAQIKAWFRSEKIWQRDLELDPLDAFKSFDIDFDGKVSKTDLKKALTSFLDIPPKEITEIRLERLFRLLSFHKTDTLQPSDFERLLGGKGPAGNPYLGPEAPLQAKETFSKSMGGGFAQTDMHDWKMSALQQIGLLLSRKYKSLEESFLAASAGTDKVNFEKFRAFIEKHDALRGFNLSVPLLQKLFGEIEPHKKTYMSLNDWKSAFAAFNANDQLVIEYKNYMQGQFVDVPSTFAYYQTYGPSPKTQIDFEQFSAATQALITNRKFTKGELQFLFRLILADSVFESFGAPNLKRFFAGATFTGKQKIYKRRDPVLESIGRKGDDRKIQKVQLMNSFGENILSRLRLLVQQSGKSLDEIFSQYDTDGSGELSRSEFRKALRALNLGLTILEINEIIRLVDVADLTGHTRYDKIEGDGKISYDEFAAKLYNMPANETRMLQRANGRLVQMKENMNLYMTSSNDAFRMFSRHKKGFLTFKEFEKLIHKLCEYSEEKMPKPDFTVLKDMFDAVDVGKDGVIDFKEWTSTFQHMGVSDKGTKTQPEPATHGEKNAIKYTGISTWNNGPEHALLGACIAKNRNSLIKRFKEHSTHSSYDGTPRFVTFDQAKKALDDLIYNNFVKTGQIQMNDEKLACVLSVGRLDQKLASAKPKEAPSFGYGYYEEKAAKINHHKEGMFDFMKILDVYKQRYDLKVSVF